MAECSRHPGNVLPGCYYCRHGVGPEPDKAEEGRTVGGLLFDILTLGAAEEKPVMLRVRGEVFSCTIASLVFEEGGYVLMLDGESRD